MAGRGLRESVGRLLDALVRENRVLPPVLAVVAVFLFAWVAAGSLLGGGGERVASREGAPDAPEVAPRLEVPDVDSYAAYQSKDPFRQLLQRSETTAEEDTGGFERTEDTGGFERTVPRERTSPGSGAGFRREDTTRRPIRQRPAPPRERPQKGLFESGGDLPPPGRVADEARVP
ncbi:hypothetical protein Rxycam_00499 [Rubrobacter xylanophilus DSM 9941]|uniref:hypothetical protein n=1 Tax=Rubrobacter xylanophilus TaxID=49319 RepID=UPI001C63C828|nr:hypothetical protein [Rubrobacter xylanophilus]QYJ14697.1 hypothetical protein Rxycam_00499 [Rubrobacter xylanophilus DSM 9941]